MKKIAMIFPYAPSYREPIYKLMDETFDVDFFFCESNHIKLKYMDYSILKNCSQNLKERVIYHDWIFFKGLSDIKIDDYDALILPGTIRNLSVWTTFIKCRLFHKNVQTLIWTHGDYGKNSYIQKIIKKIYFGLCDRILLYGEYARKKILEQNLAQDKKLTVIYNSLDYDKQLEYRIPNDNKNPFVKHFGNNNKNLVFIGRLTPVKKLDMIIEAISMLKEKGLKVNFTFIGDGVVREKLEKLSDDKGIRNQIWFYGTCFEEKEISHLLNFADLCLSPGNVGLTAMHSLAYGVPVITHGNFKEQMPEFEAIDNWETGAFFEENSIESLVETIVTWFERNQNPMEIRQKCYRVIDKFYNPHKQIEILKEIL